MLIVNLLSELQQGLRKCIGHEAAGLPYGMMQTQPM